jgi:hypothetical protein
MKLGVADTGDANFDSAVFIEGGSLSRSDLTTALTGGGMTGDNVSVPWQPLSPTRPRYRAPKAARRRVRSPTTFTRTQTARTWSSREVRNRSQRRACSPPLRRGASPTRGSITGRPATAVIPPTLRRPACVVPRLRRCSRRPRHPSRRYRRVCQLSVSVWLAGRCLYSGVAPGVRRRRTASRHHIHSPPRRTKQSPRPATCRRAPAVGAASR